MCRAEKARDDSVGWQRKTAALFVVSLSSADEALKPLYLRGEHTPQIRAAEEADFTALAGRVSAVPLRDCGTLTLLPTWSLPRVLEESPLQQWSPLSAMF